MNKDYIELLQDENTGEFYEPYATIVCKTEEDFKNMQEALEKQKEKKVCDFNEVEEDSFYHLSFMCPSCDKAIISQPYRPNHCKHCGQKLLWGEADEN